MFTNLCLFCVAVPSSPFRLGSGEQSRYDLVNSTAGRTATLNVNIINVQPSDAGAFGCFCQSDGIIINQTIQLKVFGKTDDKMLLSLYS